MRCPQCNGDGRITIVTDERTGRFEYPRCPWCYGARVVDGDAEPDTEPPKKLIFMEPTGMKELHSVRFDEEIWDFIEKSHELLGFRSRSEMINELLREVIREIHAEEPQGGGGK